MMHTGFWIGGAMAGGYLLLLWLGISRVLRAEKAGSRSPFSEKLKRPAGEGLRIQVEEVRDKMMETGLAMTFQVLAPAVILMGLRVQDGMAAAVINGVVAVVGISAAAMKWTTFRSLRTQLRKLRLGYDGERYVGEELNGLMARGYRVFHDLQVDWKPGGIVCNIDHIAVGPEGVFAVETKTRRKRLADAGKGKGADREYEVIYDGRTLRYPNWESSEQLAQAASAADDLSRWLTGTAAVPVTVTPVVVIPGWRVERKGKGRVVVFSGKEVARYLPDWGRRGALSPEQVQIFGDRIEAHCRNLEGV
jgi:hypothetical protein